MKTMILAAGRGERLRPLTDRTPKPLLPVAGRPMIEYTLEALASAGLTDIIINLAYLGNQIKSHLGNGQRFGAIINYSDEGETGLETAGGIIHALPLLGNEPFLLINGDIATDFPLSTLKTIKPELAHLVLVPNPEHHPKGDFGLDHDRVMEKAATIYTYSGIGVYHPNLFIDCKPGKARLGPLLRQTIKNKRISGEFFDGFWKDIGSRQRLEELNDLYQKKRTQNA